MSPTKYYSEGKSWKNVSEKYWSIDLDSLIDSDSNLETNSESDSWSTVFFFVECAAVTEGEATRRPWGSSEDGQLCADDRDLQIMWTKKKKKEENIMVPFFFILRFKEVCQYCHVPFLELLPVPGVFRGRDPRFAAAIFGPSRDRSAIFCCFTSFRNFPDFARNCNFFSHYFEPNIAKILHPCLDRKT